ncbi:src-like-adapter 2 [Carassius gibelio]|uniref:src-like-adapter 2 n=1 Tax=Carassius gibelio TaxID=101364 RepID=UPI002277E590|nr:src-like-adapter 2 [Carassius gibelio]XP_052465695.1 src-like-adapter 2 [Carassius gibelio]
MGCLTSRLWPPSAVQRLEDPVLMSDEAPGNHMHMAVALCNFPLQRSDEHSILLGDRLNIISEDNDMLTVRSTSTGTEVFIPHTYVCKVHSRWLFERITRKNAEQLLMLPPNYSGCFLIRESQSCPGSYSLSVRQNGGHVHNVKHYRIHQLHNGWFYIHHSNYFSTLTQLVDFYSRSSSGTFFQLTEPCLLHDSNTAVTHRPTPVTIQRSSLNWRDLSRSMVQRQLNGTNQESFVSEGLRETMKAYFYVTESSDCED